MPIVRVCSVCRGPLADNGAAICYFLLCGDGKKSFGEYMHRDCRFSLDPWIDEPDPEPFEFLEELICRGNGERYGETR